MDIPDAVIGKLVLVTTSALFVVLCLWINSYPFIDEESWLYGAVPGPARALVACGAGGAALVGGLMLFTLYHLHTQL